MRLSGSFFPLKILYLVASRPGRKAKNKPVVTEDPVNGNGDEKNGSADGQKPEINSITKDLQLINFSQDILSSLVSPIRKDLIFGEKTNLTIIIKFSFRKVGSQGNCHF